MFRIDWYELDACPADEVIQVAQSFSAVSRLNDDGDLDEPGDGHQARMSGFDGFDEVSPFVGVSVAGLLPWWLTRSRGLER